MSIETTQKIVNQMRAQGNQPGVVRVFKREMENWAKSHAKTADGQALLAWLPKFHERPFYTARELVPLFPALALALGFDRRLNGQKSSKRLANELIFCKLPRLMNADGGFTFRHPVYGRHDPVKDEFFIVEHIHRWEMVSLNQLQFETEFSK